MSDMDVNKPGIFQRAGNFVRREIEGDKKEKEDEGTWSNSTMDYVSKGAVTGGLLGGAMGAVGHYAGQGDKDVTYKYEVPIMKKDVIGQIPANHISERPDIGDPKFVKPDGKPVDGMGVKIYGTVPEKGLLGGFKMEEKTAEAHWQGSSLLTSVLGGVFIGAISGALAGVAMKILNGIIHPQQSQEPWQQSAPPAWSNSAPPPWQGAEKPPAWSESAPAWNNDHNRSHSNYSDTHSRSHGNYGDTHSNYSDTHYRSHNNYSDIHSNYSNTHSNYSDSHSNYSNSHSNAWDRSVTY